ncbi:hypothetical protein N7462_004563 [Penicillium macrosclerotiorum]|uniref:uncharacterized protein n=1 Tax=Penicillium macrosclerotiorum TaxID=303699 RepID=UPI00254678FF|nr:uncharacterized protein N7462_004563 [Penicillium macrosclerotiorum]KAJ5690171.1 hypothetical protein N7462_004563 [Penicillium macrosclerotiorum]
MTPFVLTLEPKIWTKGPYLISTDASLIPVQELNAWFSTQEIYWAKPMPEQFMRETLQRSLCFGMYHSSDAECPRTENESAEGRDFIGIARCITDFTTFIYLTDVYILPSHQGCGLGTWLMQCVQEVVESMPYLRRSLLFTGDWKRSVPFYEKVLDMEVHKCIPPTDGKDGEGLAVMMRKGRGNPTYKENSLRS